MRWVWSPNAFSAGASWPSLASLYPGDSYVDWVALDGYNDGTDTNAGSGGWQSFTQLFGYSYDALSSADPKADDDRRDRVSGTEQQPIHAEQSLVDHEHLHERDPHPLPTAASDHLV